MPSCSNCGKKAFLDIYKTVYGDKLCADCWNEYINTDKGLVEYLVAVANGDYDKGYLDADFTGLIMLSWEANKNLFDPKWAAKKEAKFKAIMGIK